MGGTNSPPPPATKPPLGPIIARVNRCAANQVMKMAFAIWICDTDEMRLNRLRTSFAGYKAVKFFHLSKEPEVLYVPGLDAVYLSPPYAERWGATPTFYRAEILKTGPEERAGGMLPYVVSGVMMRLDDDRGPLSQVQLLVESVLEAVVTFNEQNPDAIRSVGFLGRNVASDPVQADDATRIIKEAYEKKLLAA
jgi:hypothetical protein